MTQPTHDHPTAEAGDGDGRYVIGTLAPKAQQRPLVAVGAEGSWVRLADGTWLLDLHGQHMCMGVGHRHPALVAALHRTIDRLDYVNDMMAHEDKGRAARLLAEETMEGSGWAGGVRFVSSGSEAVEMAMLMARLFQNRPLIVTRDLAYHGWTAGAAAATGAAGLRGSFTGADGRTRPVPTPHAPYPFAPAPLCSACPLGLTYPECKDSDGTLACVRATERLIRSVGVDRVAAFLTEIWHGAGAFLVPDEYPIQIRAMTRRLGVLWIDDEAIGGPARTGRWWAFQHYDAEPDIMTAAKGIGSSAVPVGACVVSEEIAALFHSGSWGHGSTFSGHPLAMAAVVATIEIIRAERLVERAAELGTFLTRRLGELVRAHPCVGGISGRGLVWAIDLVRDPTTGARWVGQDRWHAWGVDETPPMSPAAAVAYECGQRGVMLLPYAPNTVTLAPPLTISEAELEVGLTAVDEALSILDAMIA